MWCQGEFSHLATQALACRPGSASQTQSVECEGFHQGTQSVLPVLAPFCTAPTLPLVGGLEHEAGSFKAWAPPVPADCIPCRCRLAVPADGLPQIAVVFIFANEALSVILRSVHSVVNHTPSRLLKEIVLVDDNSDNGEWGQPAGWARESDREGQATSPWRLREAPPSSASFCLWPHGPASAVITWPLLSW